MKHCINCNTDKDEDEFSNNQSFCKQCACARSAEWYQENKARQILNAANTKLKYRQNFRDLKDGLSCTHCGEDARCCLEFHHIDPSTKADNVTNMVSRTTKWSVVLEEIEKCVVLCSNCHKKFHDGIIQI